ELDNQVKSAKKNKKTWTDEVTDKMEDAARSGNQKELFHLVKEVTGKSNTGIPTIKGDDGEILKDPEKVKEQWTRYFKELLNRPPPQRRLHRSGPIGEGLDLCEEPPTRDEVEKAIRKLKNNKASGLDGIAAELMKYGPTEMISKLHQLIIRIWEREEVPEDWTRSLICPIYKKGDKSLCSNYRGISLLSVPGKVFGHILLDRMRDAVDKKLRENQGGFRRGRGCVDQIFCLRTLMEKCIEYQLPAFAIFVDFKAAFDSVHRPSMWHILQDYGIPDKFIRLIRAVYQDCEAAVLVENEKTDWFRIETGVRQGCVWSPLLFGVLIDFVLRKACDQNRYGICIRERKRTLFGTDKGLLLPDLDYADDVTLLETSDNHGNRLLNSVARAGGEVGLSVSVPKTKGMGIGDTTGAVQLEGQQLDTEDHFRMLGSTVMSNGRLDEEVKIRIGRASAAFGQLSKVWRSRVSLRTKLRIYNAVVISTLLYAAETWATTQTEEKRLDAFDTKCLRRILNVKWFHRVRNTEIRARTEQQPVSLLLKRSRLR
ncbi:MAG: reverse transcriptase family protein, partial [Candidatus Omnitrophica bacterium]|nr:reverse transcriptase family protein [Candidatus Omnitrophota bacterium]